MDTDTLLEKFPKKIQEIVKDQELYRLFHIERNSNFESPEEKKDEVETVAQ